MPALRVIALWISVSLGVLIAIPNPNVPFEDDLAVLQFLLIWPAFGFLYLLIARNLSQQPPKFLALLTACAVAGSFHSCALLLHSTSQHQLTKLIQPLEPGLLAPSYGHSKQGVRGALRRTRHFAHGSGSYVFESLYQEGREEGVALSYSGNRPRAPLPNWILPLQVRPFSLQPQYWIAAYQYQPRQSVLLSLDSTGNFEQVPAANLWIAVLLVLAPWLAAWRWDQPKLGWALLVAWCLLFRPWMAWMW